MAAAKRTSASDNDSIHGCAQFVGNENNWRECTDDVTLPIVSARPAQLQWVKLDSLGWPSSNRNSVAWHLPATVN